MSLTEFWSFCKTCKIPTRTLNCAKIDLLFVSIDSKYKDAPHNPSRSFTLGEFLEGLVRLSILRQSTPMTPEVPLPECLEHLLEHQIFAHSDGTDGVRPVVPTDEFNDGVTTYASDRAVRYRLHKSGVARMLKLHQKQLLKVFRKHAKSSMSATGVHDDTMQYDEWVALMKKAELLDDSLSRVVLTDCFVKAQLDDSAVAVEWKNAADSCKTLIFPEFEEALGRAALVKFEHDHLSSDERKVHEIVQLLLASPAGIPKPKPAPSLDAQLAAAAEARRRRPPGSEARSAPPPRPTARAGR